MKWDGLIKLLRLFAEMRNYSVVDRVANALSSEAVEVALYDAVRAARSMAGAEDEETKIALSKLGAGRIEDVLPTDEELESFIAVAKKDLSVAREVAIKALGRLGSGA